MPICKSDYFDKYISSRGTKIDKYRSMFSRAVPLYGIFVVVNLEAACFKGNATVASLRDLKHWWVTPLFIWILNSSVKYSLSVQRLDKATSVDKQDIYYSTLENLFFQWRHIEPPSFYSERDATIDAIVCSIYFVGSNLLMVHAVILGFLSLLTSRAF